MWQVHKVGDGASSKYTAERLREAVLLSPRKRINQEATPSSECACIVIVKLGWPRPAGTVRTSSSARCRVSGFGFRLFPGRGFWAGFGFRPSALRVSERVSGFGFRVSDFGLKKQDFSGFWAGFGFRLPGSSGFWAGFGFHLPGSSGFWAGFGF